MNELKLLWMAIAFGIGSLLMSAMQNPTIKDQLTSVAFGIASLCFFGLAWAIENPKNDDDKKKN